MSGTTKKLCCLSIGMETYIMPAVDGMKVAALLQGAKPATRDYAGSGEFTYTPIEDEADVSWTAIRSSQVIQRTPPAGAPKPAGRRRGVAAATEAT